MQILGSGGGLVDGVDRPRVIDEERKATEEAGDDEAFLLADRKRVESDAKFKRRGTLWFPGDRDHEQQEAQQEEEHGRFEEEQQLQEETDAQSEEDEDGGTTVAVHEDTGHFPTIPDYVFEPVYQREWEYMSRQHARRGRANCVVAELVEEEEDEEKDQPGLARHVGQIDPMFAVYHEPSTSEDSRELEEEIAADMGPSIIGMANNVLGSVPLLRAFGGLGRGRRRQAYGG